MYYNENVWYGAYGGCFISDAFTLSCDNYYEEFKKAAASEEFWKSYEEVKNKYAETSVTLEEKAENGEILCYAGENYGALLGTAMLAKWRCKKAVFGARYADEALLCAEVCADLQVSVKMFLSKEIGTVRSLTDQLSLLGAEIDTKTCDTLFNLPEMYAFQNWISDAENMHLITSRSNVGAFPQTNIAAAFCADYRKNVLKEAEEKYGMITRVVVPVVSGTDALALMYNAEDKKYMGVECDTEQDLGTELDSYCGSFTKVRRNRYTDRVLAAELMELEEKGNISLVQVTPGEAIRTGHGLSLQSKAAIVYAEKNPAEGRTLVLVRPFRVGGVV